MKCWPADTLVRKKLYSSLENLQHTAAWLQATRVLVRANNNSTSLISSMQCLQLEFGSNNNSTSLISSVQCLQLEFGTNNNSTSLSQCSVSNWSLEQITIQHLWFLQCSVLTDHGVNLQLEFGANNNSTSLISSMQCFNWPWSKSPTGVWSK